MGTENPEQDAPGIRAATRRRAANRGDVRSWLRANGHGDVVRLIDQVVARWRKLGTKTRRNWWDVLAGDSRGRPRKVAGIAFPVLPAVRQRARRASPTSRKTVAQQPPRRAPAPRRLRGPDRDKPHPFLKWAGGKRQILGEILARLPPDLGTFHEPFVGGGAVFFALRPRAAVLSDRNERLIRTYRGIKHAVHEVIEILDGYRIQKKVYLQLRKKAIDSCSDAEVAAWMIFLNKTGFNGLYRVNSRNEFNVPFGDNAGKQIYDRENLEACAKLLAHTRLECEDFSAVLDRARAQDVVYFDPPYVPLSATSAFTSYTVNGFDMKDQARLRDVAVALKERGVFVLLSNSSAPAVRELYGKHFECVPVSVSRTVNSDPDGRGRITELLIK